MTWVGWRLQRVETLIAAAMLVVLAGVAIPVGIHAVISDVHGNAPALRAVLAEIEKTDV
jgi:predicted anti-sigma-YlaC factor YlaD